MNGKRAASSGNGRYSDPDPGEGVDWKMGERAELAVMLVKDGNNVKRIELARTRLVMPALGGIAVQGVGWSLGRS